MNKKILPILLAGLIIVPAPVEAIARSSARSSTRSSITRSTTKSTSKSSSSSSSKSTTTNKNTTSSTKSTTNNTTSTTKVDSGTFSAKPPTSSSNSSTNSSNSNKTNNTNSSTNKTSTTSTGSNYTVKRKNTTSNNSSTYAPKYYTGYSSSPVRYNSGLGFWDYYMLSNLLGSNRTNQVTEQDIVKELEIQGYTKKEIDKILQEADEEQTTYETNKAKEDKKNTKIRYGLMTASSVCIAATCYLLFKKKDKYTGEK